jgi:hypothetical protein
VQFITQGAQLITGAVFRLSRRIVPSKNAPWVGCSRSWDVRTLLVIHGPGKEAVTGASSATNDALHCRIMRDPGIEIA